MHNWKLRFSIACGIIVFLFAGMIALPQSAHAATRLVANLQASTSLNAFWYPPTPL